MHHRASYFSSTLSAPDLNLLSVDFHLSPPKTVLTTFLLLLLCVSPASMSDISEDSSRRIDSGEEIADDNIDEETQIEAKLRKLDYHLTKHADRWDDDLISRYGSFMHAFKSRDILTKRSNFLKNKSPDSAPRRPLRVKKGRELSERSELPPVDFGQSSNFFKLKAEYTNGSGLATSDIVLYLRPEVKKMFNFIKSEVLEKNLIGWIIGPPGTGKSAAAMSFIANHPSSAASGQEATVFTWIALSDSVEDAKIIRYEGNQRRSLSLNSTDLVTAIIDVLNKNPLENEEETTHCIIIDGYVQNELAKILESRLTYWRNQNRSKRRLLFVTSLAARYKRKRKNVEENPYKDLRVFSWKKSEYLEAVQDDEFFKCVEQKLQTPATADGDIALSRAELVECKFHEAGGSARFMFAFTSDQVREELDSAIGYVGNMEKYLQITVGDMSNRVLNRLLVTYENVAVARVQGAHKGYTNGIVSVYAAEELANKLGMAVIDSLIKALRRDRNPALDGWLLEVLFFTQLRHEGVTIFDANSLGQLVPIEKFPISDVHVIDPTSRDFSYLPEVPEEGLWLKPINYNQGGYDAVHLTRTRIRFIQLTKAKSHDLKLIFFSRLIHKFRLQNLFNEGCSVEIIYLVENSRFHNFSINSTDDWGALVEYGWAPGSDAERVLIRGIDGRGL
jgi:hypothetical protein